MLSALGVPSDNLYGTPEQKLEPLAILGGKSARFAMKTLGTEWGRELFGEDFWVRPWEAAVEFPARLDMVVADDVRFASEVEAVRRRNGEIWCVVRSNADFQRVPTHASEDFAALDYDRVIVNDGDMRALAAQVQLALEGQLVLADL